MSDTIDIAPRPRLDAAAAAAAARDAYGIDGPVSELGSHQDRNFLVTSGVGPRVVKVANRGWGRAAIEAQNAALLHVAAAAIGIATPVPVAGVATLSLTGVLAAGTTTRVGTAPASSSRWTLCLDRDSSGTLCLDGDSDTGGDCNTSGSGWGSLP